MNNLPKTFAPRRLSIIFCLLVCAFGATISARAQAASSNDAQIVISDGFERSDMFAKYWKTSGDGVSLVDKMVRVAKTKAETDAKATLEFVPQKDTVTIQMRVRAGETKGAKRAAYILSGKNAAAVALLLTDGNIRLQNSGSTPAIVVQTFKAETWYELKFVINVAVNRFDLYVDGARKVEAAATRSKISDINKIEFGIGANNTGTLFFDDLKITAQKAATKK